MRILPLFFLLALTPANFTWAESTVSCHCFQDRAYDPQRAYAADPYFLASTKNALLASLYGLSKKDVVSAKMGGANGDSLWVGHYLAKKSGNTLDDIKPLFSTGGGWGSVVKQLNIDPEQLGPLFVAALDYPKKLAMIVVDEQLMENLDVEMLQLQQLRGQGADNQQTVMAVFLGQLSIPEPVKLFTQVEDGESSWGHLLAEQGLFNGSEIEDKWHQILGINK
jgi:hypothetical protein